MLQVPLWEWCLHFLIIWIYVSFLSIPTFEWTDNNVSKYLCTRKICVLYQSVFFFTNVWLYNLSVYYLCVYIAYIYIYKYTFVFSCDCVLTSKFNNHYCHCHELKCNFYFVHVLIMIFKFFLIPLMNSIGCWSWCSEFSRIWWHWWWWMR